MDHVPACVRAGRGAKLRGLSFSSPLYFSAGNAVTVTATINNNNNNNNNMLKTVAVRGKYISRLGGVWTSYF